MARKYIHREITKATIKSVKVEVKDGAPEFIPNEELTVVGNPTMEKATKIVKKELGEGTVTEITASTEKYRMPLEFFLEHAELVVDGEEVEESEEVTV